MRVLDSGKAAVSWPAQERVSACRPAFLVAVALSAALTVTALETARAQPAPAETPPAAEDGQTPAEEAPPLPDKPDKPEVEKKPLWEIGIAGGAAYVPDYPASEENHFDGLALPYVIFRGKILRADEKGPVRGRFVKTDRLEFDVSVRGAFSTDSDNNKARRGMDDLDFLLAAGPRLQIRLWRPTAWSKLELELPVRAVMSFDIKGDFGYRGVLTQPELAYEHRDIFDSKIKFTAKLGPVFATEELHDYFYQVRPADVRPGRPQFDADGGYLGTELSLGLSRKLSKWFRVFAGFRGGYYEGAANQDSPLFTSNLTYSIGVGGVLSFWRSERMVED